MIAQQDASAYLLLAFALVAANLPFVSEKILLVLNPRGAAKAFGWRVLELLLLYFAMGGLALVLEARAHGSVYQQGWAFYAATLCLFIVFAFPGFVYRQLWRRRSGVGARTASAGAAVDAS
jgi:hypothetical protein